MVPVAILAVPVSARNFFHHPLQMLVAVGSPDPAGNGAALGGGQARIPQARRMGINGPLTPRRLKRPEQPAGLDGWPGDLIRLFGENDGLGFPPFFLVGLGFGYFGLGRHFLEVFSYNDTMIPLKA
jgi:hypothetical protein